MGSDHPVIVFGGVTLRQCPIPVEVKGIPLFNIERSEVANGPFRLSATFHNSGGVPSLRIVENEWHALVGNWDVETTGGAIIIRDAPGHISLKLVAVPGTGIRIDRLDMHIEDYHLVGNGDLLVVNTPMIRDASFSGCLADGCRVGLSLG